MLDSAGRPLDQLGPLNCEQHVSLHNRPFNPHERAPIKHALDVGVRAINGLLTVGQGQRIGIMAGSGVGKSGLLGMIVRAAQADVDVVARRRLKNRLQHRVCLLNQLLNLKHLTLS